MGQVSNLPVTSWHVGNVPHDQQQPPLWLAFSQATKASHPRQSRGYISDGRKRVKTSFGESGLTPVADAASVRSPPIAPVSVPTLHRARVGFVSMSPACRTSSVGHDDTHSCRVATKANLRLAIVAVPAIVDLSVVKSNASIEICELARSISSLA